MILMGHDISDIAKKPDAKIPCLGCGKRDGLIAPIVDKAAILWCMRCGTLIDTEGSLDAMLPQLVRNTLMSLGYAVTSEDQKKLARQQAQQPAEDSSEAQTQSAPSPGA